MTEGGKVGSEGLFIKIGIRMEEGMDVFRFSDSIIVCVYVCVRL